MHNLSLVMFTLAIQSAVGMIGSVLLITCLNNSGMAIPLVTTLSVCLVLILVGLIFATAHLGNPRKAPFAVSNFMGSWLSREIILVQLFGSSIALMWILGIMGFHKGILILEIISFLLGVSTLWAISRVYRLKTVPVWNTVATPMDFFGTAFLMGTTTFCLVELFVSDNFSRANLAMGICICVGLAFKVAALSVSTAVQLRSKNKFWYLSQRAPSNLKILTAMGLCTAYLLGTALFISASLNTTGYHQWVLIGSFAILLLTEIYNRFCFYDAYCRIGL